MPRYFLEVQYDGTAFHGSQLQGDTPTIQRSLNKALSTLLRTEIVTFGASRTDEGVHALGNAYHFDVLRNLPDTFLYNLNAILPHSLAVTRIRQPVDPELNARFAAVNRTYRYRIFFRKNPFLHHRAFFFPFSADFSVLQECAVRLVQHTDLTTFAKRNAQTKTNFCALYESYWIDAGTEWQYVVRANRFLRGMVRALVGTQLLAARGKLSIQDFTTLISARDNTAADFSVPGFGLYLERIDYPAGSFTDELIT